MLKTLKNTCTKFLCGLFKKIMIINETKAEWLSNYKILVNQQILVLYIKKNHEINNNKFNKKN